MFLSHLDMPADRYVCFANEGFISYRIGVSDNISSSSKARTYRVNEVDISTERKTRARTEGFSPLILALFCL